VPASASDVGSQPRPDDRPRQASTTSRSGAGQVTTAAPDRWPRLREVGGVPTPDLRKDEAATTGRLLRDARNGQEDGHG
jgi:hypothetical protein